MNQNDWINLLFGKVDGHPNGIVFGTARFSEPAHFSFFLQQSGGGIYAILVPDISAKPRQFRVIYFGQAGKLRDRVSVGHEKYGAWLREAGTPENLYVSFYAMSGAEGERDVLERQLIEHYQPVCNIIYSPRGALFNEFYKTLGKRAT